MTRQDGRSSIAIAFGWASRITTIAAGMVVPGVIGFVADQSLGTLVLFTLFGFVLGVTIGIWQLVRLMQTEDGAGEKDDLETSEK